LLRRLVLRSSRSGRVRPAVAEAAGAAVHVVGLRVLVEAPARRSEPAAVVVVTAAAEGASAPGRSGSCLRWRVWMAGGGLTWGRRRSGFYGGRPGRFWQRRRNCSGGRRCEAAAAGCDRRRWREMTAARETEGGATRGDTAAPLPRQGFSRL
jgi:hypothetical protein